VSRNTEGQNKAVQNLHNASNYSSSRSLLWIAPKCLILSVHLLCAGTSYYCIVYSNTCFKEVRSFIISTLEYFKTVNYSWFIKITANIILLTFITVRLQTIWYECYNKNLLYFSSLWLRPLFVRSIANGSLYVLNSAAYVEMEVFPTVTIKVTVFSHVTPRSCVCKYYVTEISCFCFLKMKAAGPSELLAPITQQHDVTSQKTNLKKCSPMYRFAVKQGCTVVALCIM